MINIDECLITLRIDDGKFEYIKIEDSPHFQFVNGNKSPYKKYFDTCIKPIEADKNNPESHPHHPKNFQKLIDTFNVKKYGKIILKKHENFYEILDGAHRCSILKSMNYKEVNCKIK